MGFLRFWKRINILPKAFINLSKTGLSLTFGIKNLKYTMGRKRDRTTLSIPGSGLSYTFFNKIFRKK